MATKPYDQAFKFLAEQDPESLLLMLGAIEPDEQATIELLPREISMAAVLPDQAYRVISPRGDRLVHVEAWTRWEKEIPDRMVEYGPLHWFKYRLPVDSYVILFTRRGLARRPAMRGVTVAGETRLETRFHLIRVWRLSARKTLESRRPALLPFVPLMDGGREELEAGAEALRSVPDERQRSEMGLHFVMLGGLRYNHHELLELIGGMSMTPIERLRESSFYQSILREGREEGIQEGREEGRQEERRAALVREADLFRLLASKRFPGVQLGPEVEAVGDPDLLQQLAHELDDIPDPETLRRKLAELAERKQG
jgi:predicted transposase YdaD